MGDVAKAADIGCESINLEICYCSGQTIFRQPMKVSAAMDMAQIISLSGVAQIFPELQDRALQFGVFGKLKPENYVPFDGDRVEIYRSLKVDPMEARRRRVTKKTKRNTRTF